MSIWKQKDIAEKTLSDSNDVFADVINVLLYKGKRIVKTVKLTDAEKRTERKKTPEKQKV